MSSPAREFLRAAIVLAVAARAARGAPCAAIVGEDALVAAVRTTLDARGVADTASCQPVTVRLARSTAGITVAIEDGYGRTSARVVADAAGAATVVESWTRTDDVAVLLADLQPPDRAAPPHGGAASIKRDDDELPAILHHQPREPASSAGGAAVALESSLGSERSEWLGMRGTACLTFGATCAGVLVRAATNVSDPMIDHYAFDLLVGADLTFRLGGLRIVPGAAIGLGWIHSVQIAREMFGFPQPDFDAGGLRTDLHVALVLPLTHALALELDASIDLSVRADAQTYPADVAALVAEPRGFLRTGLGLRYGAP